MHRRRSSDSEALSRPSRANVPFSWENRPGMSKIANVVNGMEDLILKLAPPPRISSLQNGGGHGNSGRFMVVDRQNYQSLCTIQPSFRLNSFRLGGTIVRKEQDPFLVAYLKCTANTPTVPTGNKGKKAGKKVKTMFSFSCKYSCAVKEDCIVRMP